MNRHPNIEASRKARQGFALGVAAYGLWGVLPIYFKALRAIGPVDIVAHRILWSVPILALLLSHFRAWGEARSVVRNPRVVGLLAVTALLICGNWLLYVYAVNSGHILAGSLGYYLNPLANVLLGRIVLKERLSKLQWAAVALAAAGITALAVGALGQLWISLVLCLSFASYGLLRKTGGSSCGGYSCDIICIGSGTSQQQYDILVDSDGTQGPIWSGPATYPSIRVDSCDLP